MTITSSNRDIERAFRYHEDTKHSEWRLRLEPHYLDWSNHPQPFKLYRDLEPLLLPGDEETLLAITTPALEAIATPAGDDEGDAHGVDAVPDLGTLARILYLSAGITKTKRHPGGEIYFRAYANTGALYHIDLYLVSGDLPGLPAGVHHFGPHDFGLRRLREGDYRAVLAEACGGEPHVAGAPLCVLSVSTYWRNAWKYRARAYRHCFWDAGTLLANLLAASGVEGLTPYLALGFADGTLTRLLGLDPLREGALTVAALGRIGRPPPPAPPMPTLSLETLPVSRSEVDYPPIREMHEASSLRDGSEALLWRREWTPEPSPPVQGRVYQLAPVEPDARGHPRSLTKVICKRGSTRAFDRNRAISFEALSNLLQCSTRDVAADGLQPPGATCVDHYLIVHAVLDLPSGSYYYRREEGSVELLEEGSFRARAGHLGLDQSLPADAAVNIYSLCNLSRVLAQFGNRGYRLAQLEGGIAGGRLYLAAYAQGLGATGLTFFDDEVTELFSPHAAGKSVMFLTAIGYADRSVLRLSV